MEDGEKLIQTALDAFGRIGAVSRPAILFNIYICASSPVFLWSALEPVHLVSGVGSGTIFSIHFFLHRDFKSLFLKH